MINREYVNLWRAVIWRAAMDAFGVGLSSGVHQKGASSKSERYWRTVLRQQARNWFERPSVDFIRICDWAQLDHNWVRKGVLELLEKFGDSGATREATLRNRFAKYLN